MIAKKLRSDSGASITFALLLFLVCAALSAVVLVAATTAAGRLKNLAASDSNYYSVMSAAEYINDQMDGQAVSELTVNGNTLYFNKHMNEISEADIDSIVDSPLGKEANDSSDADDEKISAGSIDRGEASAAGDSFAAAVTRLYRTEGKESGQHTLSFAETAGSPVASMNVSIKETFDKEKGRVYMTIYPSGTGGGGMKLIYSLDSAEKFPQADQIETGSQQRVISSGTEYTWHLVKMTNAFDDNGDV